MDHKHALKVVAELSHQKPSVVCIRNAGHNFFIDNAAESNQKIIEMIQIQSMNEISVGSSLKM